MAAEENKFISRTNSGFPEYLDWEKLRATGIDYLGRLSGKVWTDHNVHDPGITILEILCYAILDLGYRTNLPVEDILARHPDEKSKDNNFFTAADILACNPVTITDLRKMLVDIPGVKNAWVEDTFYDCIDQKNNQGIKDLSCAECYNGLYRVYIETEQEFDRNDPSQISQENELIDLIRKNLMAHRNLCEDFVDIFLLCKKKIGLCADIELENDADVELVYTKIVESLRDFFSPAPKFYTLKQLLEEKNRPVEDIFAGRPYNVAQSHGFIDREEFEALTLRKEIHLSDVYHVIFDVEGVRDVKNLGWRKNCGSAAITPDTSWIWKIPENHVPDFSPGCSVMKFSRRGIPVAIDTEKFSSLFEIDFRHSGKVLYNAPSPYLDIEIPGGVYRSDLGEYQSVQNEFPRVYGIQEGGLPPDVSSERRAKAYQLKGYLLFFDQLLANYAAQLKNIRLLFTLPAAQDEKDRHSYFLNQLNDVPELQKLMRFKAGDGSERFPGSEGGVMAVPVSKNWLRNFTERGEIEKICTDIEPAPYQFCDFNDCEIAIINTQEDIFNGNYRAGVISNKNNCWWFYFFTSSEQFAFFSRNHFADEMSARRAAESVKYAGSFRENFRSFGTPDQKVTFLMEPGNSHYANYLQKLMEDEDAYQQRREEFLDHLLSRFAEKFTDFALLSYGSLKEKALHAATIENKEYFLTHYDDLSSNRGRAYDYLYNEGNANISGFERRIGALAGIQNEKRKTLCNFVVEKYEEHYIIRIIFSDGKVLFTSSEKFYSEAAAADAARELMDALGNDANYEETEDKDLMAYRLKIHFGGRPIFYSESFDDPSLVKALRHGLYKMFSFTPDSEKDIDVSKHVFKVIIRDHQGKEIATSKRFFNDEEKAREYAAHAAGTIVKSPGWNFEEGRLPFEEIVFDDTDAENLKFIDRSDFRNDINDTIVGKPGKFEYELLDRRNSFKFSSAREYDSHEEAEADSWKILIPLSRREQYEPYNDKFSDRVGIIIRHYDQTIARTDAYFGSNQEAAEAAGQIHQLIAQHVYSVLVEKRPHRWNFSYLLGYRPNEQFIFKSVHDFGTAEEAFRNAAIFYMSTATMKVSVAKKALVLTPDNNDLIACVYEKPDQTTPEEELEKKIETLLDLKKEVDEVVHRPSAETYSRLVTNDIADPKLRFVYRLVDKNYSYACYTGKYISEKPDDVLETKKTLYQDRIEYRFTEIYFANIIIERKDEGTRVKWYHYQIRCRDQRYGDANGLVLFESVKGYPSEEEAMKAFSEHYMLILNYARDEKNYGKNAFISLETIFDHGGDDCFKKQTVVFVPDPTREIFNWYPDVIIKELVEIASLYPVRYTTRSDDDFYRLFPCEEDKRKQLPPGACASKEKLAKYYYYLLHDQALTPLWQSVNYYLSADEAMRDFYFFLELLWYPGNYFVKKDECDCKMEGKEGHKKCTCKWKIYIREVLAESKKRFSTEAEAWGTEGIEKFICVSQTENSFHTSLDTENCRYTFDVYCDQAGLVHPCKYDTAEKRDKARERLIKAYTAYTPVAYPSFVASSANEVLLMDGNGIPFTIITIPNDISNQAYHKPCVADVFYDIQNNPVRDRGNGFSIDVFEKDSYNKNRLVRNIRPYDATIAMEQWKQQLCIAACNYPVIKRSNGKYDIIIRLPGFGSCDEKNKMAERCMEASGDECADCSIAWESHCCFDHCEEALAYFDKAGDCLKEASNYRRVFDCECGPYGIQLKCCAETISCCNEIIAFNPQHYVTPKSVCLAVQRAKKLINSEGLLLVEHILLRPRCEEDCECIVRPCEVDVINCNDWVWEESGEADPCNDRKTKIPFRPAKDPYSFIATVVLPAWPERFRSVENREIMENILYRETPAHILLRILWLAPAQFCEFESMYREWNRWLSDKHLCSEDFSLCSFVEFLFNTDFECLPPCDECDPCKDSLVNPKGCWETSPADVNAAKNKYLNQLNKIFCWQEVTCGKNVPIEPIDVQDMDHPVLAELPVSAEAPMIIDEIHEDLPVEEATNREEISRQKIRLMNRRKAKYKRVVEKIVEVSKENPVAEKVQMILQNPDPSIKDLSSLLTEIVKNPKPKKRSARPLTEEQAHDLIQSSICYYLDKLSFSGEFDRIRELKEIAGKLIKSKVNMRVIFNYWDPAEIKKYENDLNIEEAKELLTGFAEKK
jgi:hypothetical protein